MNSTITKSNRSGPRSTVKLTPELDAAFADYEQRTVANLAGQLVAGRWIADPADTCPGCGKCTGALAERMHQRSVAHVAAIYGAEAADLAKLVRARYARDYNRAKNAKAAEAAAAAAKQAQLERDAAAYRACLAGQAGHQEQK